jgi:hypothetical protein
VPVAIAELTVTAAVPVDESVTDCVAASLMTTLPNEIDVAFTPSAPCPAGDSCNEKVFEVPLAVAVSVAV